MRNCTSSLICKSLRVFFWVAVDLLFPITTGQGDKAGHKWDLSLNKTSHLRHAKKLPLFGLHRGLNDLILYRDYNTS